MRPTKDYVRVELWVSREKNDAYVVRGMFCFRYGQLTLIWFPTRKGEDPGQRDQVVLLQLKGSDPLKL
jgi:hypothetical protein